MALSEEMLDAIVGSLDPDLKPLATSQPESVEILLLIQLCRNLPHAENFNITSVSDSLPS